MLFNSVEYAVFLAVVFALFWLLSPWERVRHALLLVASYLFYASWSAGYLLLIVASSLVDYLVGLGFGRWTSTAARRALLITSVTTNLSILGVFKYFNFFVESADDLLFRLGLDPTGFHLDVLLPVGISFYTFQTMSYSIDLYRRKLDEPCRDPLRFFVYVSFFPQLVAGPIVRAIDFLPQLDRKPAMRIGDAGRAAILIALGLIKKVAIGDYLAINLVDRVFDRPDMFTSLEVLMGVYGYAMQIYCDFSAYTDIAIGSALLLGFRLPENFARPYQADSLQDFWRRWHISLSTWLRDYLYIPLGGSKNDREWKTYRNLLITMLLGGLWHGAAWNFVIWGAMHGGMLALTRIWQRWRRRQGKTGRPPTWYRAAAIVLTFHFVCLTWIFFRAQNLDAALAVLARLGDLTLSATNLAPTVMLALVVGYLSHFSPQRLTDRFIEQFAAAPAVVQGVVLTAVVFVIREITSSQVVPFIYFQF